MSLTPHGGVLINRVNEEFDLSTAAKEIELDAISFADLELIAIGGYSPIEGFLTKADYEAVVSSMRLASGVVWSLPITLPVTKEKAAEINQGDIVRLSYNGTVYGVIEVEDQYTPDKEKEAVNVYKTDDRNHYRREKII